jgi:hypothetical protein
MALQSQAPRGTMYRAGSSVTKRAGDGVGSGFMRGATPATKLLVVGLGVGALGLGILAWIRMSGGNASPVVTDLPQETIAGPLAYPPKPNAVAANATPANKPPTSGASISGTTTPTNTTASVPATAPAALTPPPASTPTTNPTATNPAPTAATPTGSTPSGTPTDPLATPVSAKTQTQATGVKGTIEQAQKSAAAGNLLEARTLLNTALWDKSLSAADRAVVRAQMAALNDTLFFGPVAAKNDPLTDTYTVQSGDVLVRLPFRQSLPTDYRFIQRINKMSSASNLRVGQRLKVVRVPIHAVVHKKDYRMDLWAGAPITGTGTKVGPDGQEEGWTFIRSLPVGLGESDGTPEGLFVVRPKSKLINPKWVNPRTGEVYQPDDPKNPIGEHWVGLDGADDNTRRFTGYGIHGTIDPDSIGQQRSMGCVRMRADDVALVWELLVDSLSSVKIID